MRLFRKPEAKRDRENLRKLIRKYGFTDIEDYLMQHARPSIRAETQSVNDESEIPIGASKIGGRPDLPPNIGWPTTGKSVSIAFIAQFDMQDVKPYDEEKLLPDTGMLYFFGQWTRDVGGKVIYSEASKTSLVRAPFPHDIPVTHPMGWGWGDRYNPCSVKFIPEVNLPCIDADWIEPKFPVGGKKWKKFSSLVSAASYQIPWTRYSDDVNRLLGYSYDIPDDLQLDCERWALAGKPQFTPSGTHEEYAEAEKHKAEWQLLFQMSSDTKAGMMWSDKGMICYYIRRQDLKAKNFDDVCFTGFTT